MWLRLLDPPGGLTGGACSLGGGAKGRTRKPPTPPQGLGVSSLSSLAMYPKRPPERELGAPSSGPAQGRGHQAPLCAGHPLPSEREPIFQKGLRPGRATWPRPHGGLEVEPKAGGPSQAGVTPAQQMGKRG